MKQEQQISGQMIQPFKKCELCGYTTCKNKIDGKCIGDISNLDYCPLCKADKPKK
jgi:hypothetical protein